jgi:hypothetical protein
VKKNLVFLSAVLFILCVAGTVSATPVTLTITSQPDMQVYGPKSSYLPVEDLGSAVATWVHPSWPTLAGATWISNSTYVDDPVNDSWRWFHTEFSIPSDAIILSAALTMVTSDNAEMVWLNDTLIGQDGEVLGTFVDNYEWGTLKTYSMTPLVGQLNSLDFIVRNYAQAGGTATSNPTGLIFKAEVQYAPVPEPATMLLLGTGLIGLAGVGRKKLRKA